MNKATIDGREYIEYGGCFVPVDCVREDSRVTRPEDILSYVAEYKLSDQENCILLTLDASNQVINKHEVTKGLVNQSQMHPREVFRNAILDNAVSMVIVHNHPSGVLSPSVADLAITKRLVEVSKVVGISVLDHVIVSSKGHKSIRETNPEQFI